MALKELGRVVVENTEEGLQTTRLPDNEEMMNKINEIVRYVNRLEKTKQDIPIKGFGVR